MYEHESMINFGNASAQVFSMLIAGVRGVTSVSTTIKKTKFQYGICSPVVVRLPSCLDPYVGWRLPSFRVAKTLSNGAFNTSCGSVHVLSQVCPECKLLKHAARAL